MGLLRLFLMWVLLLLCWLLVLLGSWLLLLLSRRLLLSSWLVVTRGVNTGGVSALLDSIHLFLVVGHVFEEVLLQVIEVLVQLLHLLVSHSVVLLHRLLLLLTLGHLQVLLSAKLTIENCGHDLLLLGLEGVVVETPAQTHHRDSTFSVSDGRH